MSEEEKNLVEHDYEGEKKVKMGEEEDNEENLLERDYEGEMTLKMREEEDNEENLLERDYEGEKKVKMGEEDDYISEGFEKLFKKFAEMRADQNEKLEEMNLKLQKQQDMLAECLAYNISFE